MEKSRQMISHFYDITIEMEPKNNYLSHLYAIYGHHTAMFSIESGELMEGTFPEKESDLVAAWVLLHQQELKMNWERSLQDSNYRMSSISSLV
ncbi:MAG: DUF4160 domain-containing protein [Candidatus Protochlamydia sp.]|nr:DUF4160 domain-containing protein [Candidatus Protochlamydia sp.]